MLSLLKRAAPSPPLTAEITAEDPLSVMYLAVATAHCRRRDVARALAAVSEMEEETGRPPSAKVFLSLLEACSIPRPPLVREAEAVWAQIEVRLTVPIVAVC